MSFYPALPTDTKSVMDLYEQLNVITRLHLQATRQGFLAVHVGHALWADWVGREFATERLVGEYCPA